MRLRPRLLRLAAETTVRQRRSALAASRSELEVEAIQDERLLSLQHGLERWTLPAWMLAPHPTPLRIIGDVTVPEWPAGPRREEHARQRNARQDAKNPPGPGGPLWRGDQLLVEKRQRHFPRYRWQETLNGVAPHPFRPSHTLDRCLPYDLCSRYSRNARAIASGCPTVTGERSSFVTYICLPGDCGRHTTWGRRGRTFMWHDFQLLIGRAHTYMAHLDRNEWVIVFIVVILVGTFCLRGFGSRLGY